MIAKRAVAIAMACGALACANHPPPAARVTPPALATETPTPSPSASPVASFPLGKELVLQIIVERENDAEAEALAKLLSAELAASGHRTVVGARPREPDPRAQVLVLVGTWMAVAGADGVRDPAEATAIVTVRDPFGVTIGTRRTNYLRQLGFGPQHTQRLLEACTGETLEAYARTRPSDEQRARDAADEAARTKRLAEEKAQRERADAEALWDEGRSLSECLSPSTLHDCEALQAYLSRYPSAPHAEEARRGLTRGQPAVNRILEQMLWEAADVEICREPRRSTDCDRLRTHLATFPDGAHVREARRVLARSKAAVERLRLREEEALPRVWPGR